MTVAPPSFPDAGEAPDHWICQADGSGGLLLRYAVRSGGWHGALVAGGAALVVAGLWAIRWMFTGEGELTPIGWVFTALVPGGAVLAGIYVLHCMLWARTDYVLTADTFSERRRFLRGMRRTDVPRSAISPASPRNTRRHARMQARPMSVG